MPLQFTSSLNRELPVPSTRATACAFRVRECWTLASMVETLCAILRAASSTGTAAKFKTCPIGGHEEEQLVNTAPPPLPELHPHRFSLRASGHLQSRDTLLTATAILWIFCGHQVNRLNQPGNEMMCSSGIRVEHCLCWIRKPIEGLMRSGKD